MLARVSEINLLILSSLFCVKFCDVPPSESIRIFNILYLCIYLFYAASSYSFLCTLVCRKKGYKRIRNISPCYAVAIRRRRHWSRADPKADLLLSRRGRGRRKERKGKRCSVRCGLVDYTGSAMWRLIDFVTRNKKIPYTTIVAKKKKKKKKKKEGKTEKRKEREKIQSEISRAIYIIICR